MDSPISHLLVYKHSDLINVLVSKHNLELFYYDQSQLYLPNKMVFIHYSNHIDIGSIHYLSSQIDFHYLLFFIYLDPIYHSNMTISYSYILPYYYLTDFIIYYYYSQI